jgi:hypothetical protein
MHIPNTRCARLGATAAILIGTVSLPATAHFTSSPTPHAHPGDVWGLLAVVALTAVAGWIDRRARRGRIASPRLGVEQAKHRPAPDA